MTNAELRQAFLNRIEVKEVDPLDAYKGKWANLWFLYTGESFSGACRYNSETEAKAAAEGWLNKAALTPERPMATIDQRKVGRKFYMTDISHVVQIPVKS